MLRPRPTPRTFKTKTKTETLGLKTKTFKIQSRDVSRPRLKSWELQARILPSYITITLSQQCFWRHLEAFLFSRSHSSSLQEQRRLYGWSWSIRTPANTKSQLTWVQYVRHHHTVYYVAPAQCFWVVSFIHRQDFCVDIHSCTFSKHANVRLSGWSSTHNRLFQRRVLSSRGLSLVCIFKSIMPIWCYLSRAQSKSGITPKFGVIFGVTPEFTPDFQCYLKCNTRNLVCLVSH